MKERSSARRLIGVSLLVITPAYNESDQIERVARAMAAQTRPPDEWIVVDDGSSDDTVARTQALRDQIPFLRVIETGSRPEMAHVRDRLASASEARAFNVGLAARSSEFDHVCKLDADIELPADYFERLLAQFAIDPQLGIVGGALIEDHGQRWERIPVPDHHVHGALRIYSRACFEAAGGIRETLGWDTADLVAARLHGWSTQTRRDVVARHHRHWGSANGVLRGRARHGVCAWICGYPPYFVALRAVKLAVKRPYGLTGLAFAWGYARAAVSRVNRVEAPIREANRAELRVRLRRAVRPAKIRAVIAANRPS